MLVEVSCNYFFIKDFEKIDSSTKKKNCNKKFCYDCLQKYFTQLWELRDLKSWKCPCCLGLCTCSQCKKNWMKIKSKNFRKIGNDFIESNETTSSINLINNNLNFSQTNFNENTNSEKSDIKFSLFNKPKVR